ncbi:MAG: efflux RND transporter periplasmic adaptor subunit [Lonepinella koalarum]|nr:efflux RND transporter periplasmic adaptor subunit [Lonepinella koalarum]
MKKKPIIILLALLIAGSSTYFFMPNTTQSPTFLTEEVKRTNIFKTVVASGTIESANKVNVGSQVSGKIIRLYVKLGQEVKQGDLIAQIDSTTQMNMLNTKKAALASYKAQLQAKNTIFQTALSQYERQSKLYAQKSTSLDSINSAKNSLEMAKAEVKVLEENVKQAEIEVNTAETNLNYTKITSPIDGTIISTPISEGQTVNANQTTPTIVTVANLDKMRIKPQIAEGDIIQVKAGQEVRFKTLSDNNQFYQGIIESVDPATTTITDASSTTSSLSASSSSASAVYYYANMLIDNPNRALRIGMTTENTIKIAEAKNVLSVPNMALQRRDEQYVVQVLKEKDEVEQRIVNIGIHNDARTEITSGLQEGEIVILSQVSSGEKVGTPMRTPRLF